jgi:L,D-peptidoglycan transpeptidase YkuD (ErfK/YbiS/YcfS/YnhG family)
VRRLPLLLALAALGLPGHATHAARCASALTEAGQLVTVAAPDARSTTATLRVWQRHGECWEPAAGPWEVYIGYAGLSSHHVEGDGTTPTGAFAIAPVLYGVGADPGVHLRYRRLRCGDWWDEDPSSPTYNTFRHVPCGSRPPFGGSSEPLWRSTRAYVHLAFLEYNTHPAVPGRGSAIFIHADLGHPTNGCISLPPEQLVQLLRLLRAGRHPLVLIGTTGSVSATMGA